MYGCFIDDPRPYGLLISPMYGEAQARENEWRIALPGAEPVFHKHGGGKKPITDAELEAMVERVKVLRAVEIASIEEYLNNPAMVWSEHYGKMVIDRKYHSQRSQARARLVKLQREPWAHKEWKKTKRELKIFREAKARGLF